MSVAVHVVLSSLPQIGIAAVVLRGGQHQDFWVVAVALLFATLYVCITFYRTAVNGCRGFFTNRVRLANILVLGLDGAGKTTILQRLTSPLGARAGMLSLGGHTGGVSRRTTISRGSGGVDGPTHGLAMYQLRRNTL